MNPSSSIHLYHRNMHLRGPLKDVRHLGFAIRAIQLLADCFVLLLRHYSRAFEIMKDENMTYYNKMHNRDTSLFIYQHKYFFPSYFFFFIPPNNGRDSSKTPKFCHNLKSVIRNARRNQKQWWIGWAYAIIFIDLTYAPCTMQIKF